MIKFLSAYDAIAYAEKYLEDGMVVNVKGNLKYSSYQGNTQVRKNVTSIVLSKAEDNTKYSARFTQTILLDKASASLKNIDKNKGVMFVEARVLDYVKEIGGKEVKGQYPFVKTFEFEMDFSNKEQCEMVMDKVFKVKKDITQMTFEGDLSEGGAVVTVTWEEVPQAIKDLVAMGMYSKEEAIAKCSTSGSREQRMILRKPFIKKEGEDKIPTIQRFDGAYKEEDLVLDYLTDENESYESSNTSDETTEESSENGMDWLNNL